MAAQRAREGIVVVTSTWPVVVMVLPEVVTEAEIDELIRATESIYARGERFAMIVDTRGTRTVPGARERKLLTGWLARPDHVDTLKRLSVASVTLIESALVRGSLQAILWLWSPPSPHSATHDLDEALSFVVSKLEAAGLARGRTVPELRGLVERELARARRSGH